MRHAFISSVSRKISIVRFIFLIGLIVSCSQSKSEKNLTPLAEVFEHQLFLEDLNLDKYEFESSKDSLETINHLIDQWIRKIVLVETAEDKVSNTKEIEKKVQDFKADLMIHELHSTMIEESLDTTVSEIEIKEYYQNHKDEFILKDYLVKVLYIKVPSEIPEVNKIDNWYKLYQETDISQLQQVAQKDALNFYYDTESWIYFQELTKEIPLKIYSTENFILNKSHVKIEEDGVIYYLNILDYRLKDAMSPLEFEKNNIKKRIINQRILRYKKELEDSLIQSAYDKGKVTIN